MPWLKKIFPFLAWFKGYSLTDGRADLISGVTVALVLIPQSMAYAQLAGLPGYYGLYAAFLPPMAAALFGSSRQLATGPVAVVSLMTSAALEPLATAGGPEYIAYAVLLAFIVGMIQLTLGVLRLGVLVNFLSHPVVNGFTNAAAIIIATSQLSKVFGVTVDKADHHYETIYRVLVAAVDYTHWPTFGLAALAFAIMFGLRRINRKLPNVLVAVALCTVISWLAGFKADRAFSIAEVHSPDARALIAQFNKANQQVVSWGRRRTKLGKKLEQVAEQKGQRSEKWLEVRLKMDIATLTIAKLKARIHVQRQKLRTLKFEAVKQGDRRLLYPKGSVPSGLHGDGRVWRIVVGQRPLDTKRLTLRSGGAVVGRIPKGLPSIGVPKLDLGVILHLLSTAMIISLLGFMEAISIASAMARRTGQRLDANQELIGQGLGNILGSVTQSYATSGSFSRSAVNIQSGAVSGLSSVFTSLVVIITLLFLTPLLYHLPQSVLASVIMMAVIGLINVKGFVHAWHANHFDGAISVISFVATLVFAPHLDIGIMIGVGLSLLIYLRNIMKPHVTCLALHPDGSLRDADAHDLPRCRHIAIIRVDGALFFANASYMEEKVLLAVSTMPELRHVLVVANGINDIDASGEEVLSRLVDRTSELGLELSFSGMKGRVLDTLRRTHLIDRIGEDHLHSTQVVAISEIFMSAHRDSDEDPCPLEGLGRAAQEWPLGT